MSNKYVIITRDKKVFISNFINDEMFVLAEIKLIQIFNVTDPYNIYMFVPKSLGSFLEYQLWERIDIPLPTIN